jgi:hypothetical protein
MSEVTIPDYLKKMDEIQNIVKYCNTCPNAEELADIAFELVKLSKGDAGNVDRISSYIQAQHNELKAQHKRINDIGYTVSSWVRWAAIWTDQRSEPRKDEPSASK